MPDFLAENNLCGQTILHLVARGNAIIAEILRLKDYIPTKYRLSTKDDIQRYSDIVMDFNYFKIEEQQNMKIENSQLLHDLDDEFRDNHLEIINRFYLLFESIHIYVIDLNQFLDDLDDGIYIQQTLETIFIDLEGKQLLCESLHLYGLMLLMIDEYIDGPIRERLLVSYYRYTPQRSDTQSRIDDICKLLRDTGYNSTKRPNNYPEDYFKRIPIKSTFIEMVISHLRSDDIYQQLNIYQLPKYRTIALSTQSSMLYICLYFNTTILHTQSAIMREIVDKYFPDNWILSIYMGYTVNLIERWDNFKAARLALNNTIEIQNIKQLSRNFQEDLVKLIKSTNMKLKEGILTDESVLKDIQNLLNLLRDCNLTIRWLMLHTTQLKQEKNKRCKQLRDFIINELKYEKIYVFKLLLNTAQLELIIKEIYKELLHNKDEKWHSLKEQSYKNLLELSQIGLIDNNKKLKEWFIEIAKQINNVEIFDNRKIVQLLQALEEVEEFHQLNHNLQILQLLYDTRKSLNLMLLIMKNIKEDFLINLQIIADLSYAWLIIENFTEIMQQGIEKDSILIKKLRAVFVKLSSALEIPLLRLNQSQNHDDLISVSQYYSGELEIYIRRVLQIIPIMIFMKLSKIIDLQTNILKDLPTRLDKHKLKDYAQLNERYQYSELINSISNLSQGILLMKQTLVGVICLDPKQLLEDGIRQELVKFITKSLHTQLVFNNTKSMNDFELKLQQLSQLMVGYKQSFESIQDYMNINGWKLWQDEIKRLINFHVEQECNRFLRIKINTWESIYQNRYVPIPTYQSIDSVSVNFIGRLAREIIRLSDPRQSVYIEQFASWYDIKTHKTIINKETMNLIASALEISGLVGLDRLFSFMIVSNLQKIYNNYLENSNHKNKNIETWYNVLTNIRKEIQQINIDDNQQQQQNLMKFYQNCINRTNKIWNEFLDCMLTIGQLQLLRNLIGYHLNKSCRFNAKNLEASLRSLNKALILDVTHGQYTPSEELFSTLSPYFDYAGLNNPFNKIYITTRFNLEHSITIFVFVIAHLHRLFILKNPANLQKKISEQIDGTAFAVAVHTLIKQFHCDFNENFLKLLTNYITQLTRSTLSNKTTELPPEIGWVLNFIDTYTNYSEISKKYFRENLPEEIYHLQQTLIN